MQRPLQLVVLGDNGHLRLQVPVHRAMAKVRGSNQRRRWQRHARHVQPQPLGMECPALSEILEQADAVGLAQLLHSLKERAGYVGVGRGDVAHDALCTEEAVGAR